MIKEFWVVTCHGVDESTTPGDVCFKSTPQTVGLQFLGGLSPKDVVGFYETEKEAVAAAQAMLKGMLERLEKETAKMQARLEARLKENPPRPQGKAYWKKARQEAAQVEAGGPGEEDIIIDPAGVPHQDGKAIGVEEKDISIWMFQHGFFPNVWQQDDHGGVILLVKDMGEWVDAKAYYHKKIQEAK